MKVESSVAYSFILNDDIYLIGTEKCAYKPEPALSHAIEIIPATEIKAVTVNYKFMGGNKKKFLILVHYHESEFMNEKHLSALENTLKRLEYSLDDIAIFNIFNYPEIDLIKLNDFFTPQKLLIMGERALPGGNETLLPNKLHQLNSTRALFTFSFDEMMDNNENKKAFWEQMKQL